METETKLTAREAFAEIEEFRKIFTVVRLLKKNEIAGICRKEELGTLTCPCYSFWQKDKPCENCVSLKAYLGRKEAVKLEFSTKGIYQVIARFVEVDGEPCVIELIRAFEVENVIDMADSQKLVFRLNEYYEKTYTDVMTGVYNRRFYEEKLRKSTLSAGVAMIDLDDFKIYNDVYGHSAGDDVLKAVSDELKKGIRTSDKIIRYGGDEFLLVMPGIKEESFEKCLQNVLRDISRIVLPNHAEIKLTTSIGATLCRNERVEDATNRADRLLYRAKRRKNVLVTDREGKTQETIDRPNILVVDDSEINREILKSILRNEFNVFEAKDGKECVEFLREHGNHLSLVLLDIIMPEMSGFEVLDYMTKNRQIEEIPVITITGDESWQTIRKAYEMGVSDFISRPFDTKVVYRRVLNTINLYEKQRRLTTAVSDEILEKEKNSRILVDILGEIADFREGSNGEHFSNINKITEILLVSLLEKTSAYGLTDKDVYLISTAAALHDIGKIGINDAILGKPGKLTAEEFEAVKKHTLIGAELIRKIRDYQDEPLVKYAYEICRWHHEKYDGRGYPDGLKGDEIPIAAQVVSLAGVYDALTAKRPYKEAYSTERAIGMIQNGECGCFHPVLLQCLEEVKDRLVKNEAGDIQ